MFQKRTAPYLILCVAILCAAAADAQTIQGVVFVDMDGNGIFNDVNAGGGGNDTRTTSPVRVDIVRTDTGATVVTTTVVGGTYSVVVPALALTPTIGGGPPTFIARFTLPAASGLVFITPNQGFPPQIDSDVDSGGESQPLQFVNPILTVNVGLAQVTDPAADDDAGGGDGAGGAAGAAAANAANAANLQQPLVAGGVEIDAAGVLRLRRQIDPRLNQQRARQLRASMDPMLARPSALRKISLNRLEEAVTQAVVTHGIMPDEMAYLAGLTSITNVFLMPATGDVIIAGPAEGFSPDVTGRMVGIKSNQATMQLQDLIVALRCFPPGGAPTPVIGCSIDPTPEGLQRMQQYIQEVASQVTPSDDLRFAAGLQQSLGSQVVTVEGVPANTHFAQVLVEADYRMKLIGIGLENPPVSITSYIKRASPHSVARNALQRWYFQPNYDCVRVSDDGLTMQLEGEGVKLVGANERVQRDGRRAVVGRVDRASQAFVRSFTQRYAALARKESVFGQLRNLIDCSIVAAYLQQEDVYGQCNWEMAAFADESILPVEVYHAPKTVDAAVNVVWKGGALMTPIGGGVSIETSRALVSSLGDEDGLLDAAREKVSMPELARGQWWWD